MNVKFVQDTSKYWYKPDISREQGESQELQPISAAHPLIIAFLFILLIFFL